MVCNYFVGFMVVSYLSEQEQFSELYGGFFYKQKRTSSSIDLPSCPTVISTKKLRVDEIHFVSFFVNGCGDDFKISSSTDRTATPLKVASRQPC